jgi:2-furoyl-CoA dehydrogenase FAD binding subunit
MKPARFDYLRAETMDEALVALSEAGGDARILAGGQSLLPMLNMRLSRPAVVVDIMRIASLRTIEERGGALVVGAGVRQVELERRTDLPHRQPLLAAALAWIGHAQTRSRGTLCGSVAHADPSAEIPLALVALGGHIHLRSRRNKREIAATDFFAGTMLTERAEDEMVEAIAVPLAKPGTGYAFREVGRRFGDYAIAACAAVVDDKTIRLGIGGVADRPVARDLGRLADAQLDDALDEFAWSLEARDDGHATARYRRELVRRLGRETIAEASRCRA